MKGIKEYRNKAGFYVMEVHYSSDPDKDINTPQGKAWYEKTRKDVSTESWEREYEINWLIGGGNKVYLDFKRNTHTCKLEYNKDLILYRVWDFGYHHPCVLYAQINTEDQLCILREYQGTDLPLSKFKMEVMEFTNDHFGENVKTKDFCDPAGKNVSDLAGKTYVDIMRSKPYKVIVRYKIMRKRIAIEFIRTLLLIRNDGNPGILIDERNCPILVDGMAGGYCTKEKDPETPIDDGWYEHTQDCAQYFATNLHRKLGLLRRKDISDIDKEEKRTKKTSYNRRSYNSFTGY